MCCCGGEAKWKREVINDHKFDYVDVDEFYEDRFLAKFKYCFVFVFTIKSILIYVLDLYTAVMLIFFNTWTSDINDELQKLDYIRWIFVGSILASYLLLFLEVRKAKAVILSRDISFTFTSIIANRYYTLRSYAHYCFFNQIHNQKRFKDELAFFVFFALKGWKRLFFAEAARRFVNGYTIYFFFRNILKAGNKHWFQNITTANKISLVTMGIPCLLFIMTAMRTIFAAILYIPLVCEIRGNLKEYCCHKIDKRIAELLRSKNRKRIMRDQLLNGTIQPTKPNVDVLDEEIMMQSVIASSVNPNEKRCTVNYSIDGPIIETPATRGHEYGGRRMSKNSLVSESTVTSAISDRRAQTIAANREYRSKQQKYQQPQHYQQGPTLPYIENPHPELIAGDHVQGRAFPNPPHPMLHPGSKNYIPVDSRSASECSEQSSSTVYGHLPGPPCHYGNVTPYTQYNYEPPVPMPMAMPMPEIYSQPSMQRTRIPFNDSDGNDTRVIENTIRPISPTQSETSSRSASTHPSRGYQVNMTTVHEEMPNRYQDRYTAANRSAQSRGLPAKPSNHTKTADAKNAINF